MTSTRVSVPAAADPRVEVTSRSLRLKLGPTAGCAALLVLAIVLGCAIGPIGIPPVKVLATLMHDLTGANVGAQLSDTERAILFQIRLPRVALGVLVGGLLAGCGATYQGAFRNPLANPYLLGAAAGAGLGAVLAISLGLDVSGSSWIPLFAFVGALAAVSLTYAVGASGLGRGTTSLILAGVAVSAFLGAIQTLLLQQNLDQIQQIYSWLLGRLTTVGWGSVLLVLPYAAASLGYMLINRRVLDVMGVGDDEARTLGLNPQRVRVLLVIAASLGTAAAVSVSGLIGFVGLVVPHLVRLAFGSSYRSILPLSILAGGALLVLADIAARMVISPGELPIGVVTAFLGAPFFLLILRRSRHD